MSIFAHLGGIDEIGTYLIPILLAIAALRRVEKRRGSAAEEKQTKTPSEVRESDA